jgi:hypothetical protein
MIDSWFRRTDDGSMSSESSSSASGSRPEPPGRSERTIISSSFALSGRSPRAARSLDSDIDAGSRSSAPDKERGADSPRVMRPTSLSFRFCVATSLRERLDSGARLPMVRLWIGRAALCRRVPPDLRSVMGSSLLV